LQELLKNQLAGRIIQVNRVLVVQTTPLRVIPLFLPANWFGLSRIVTIDFML